MEIRWKKDHKLIGPNVVETSAVIELIGLPEQDINEVINKAKRVGAQLGMIKQGNSNPKEGGVIVESK